jgi:membrane-associated phospholipid phosphatase
LHLGWATWVAVSLAAAYRTRWSWRRRWLFFLYPLAVALNVVAAGAHWLLDTIAGTALLLAVVGIYGLGERFWRARAEGSAARADPVDDSGSARGDVGA